MNDTRTINLQTYTVCVVQIIVLLGFLQQATFFACSSISQENTDSIFRATELVQADDKLMAERKPLGYKSMRPNYIKPSYKTEKYFGPHKLRHTEIKTLRSYETSEQKQAYFSVQKPKR